MIESRNMARRRTFLAGATALGLAPLVGCARAPVPAGGFAAPPLLPRPRIGVDRITAITVCTRPFRADGPRLETERVGDKQVVHHYGHGGSGWSLSWGSAALAVDQVRMTGADGAVAVIGCGAIGLTTALQLQRAGFGVTIYAKDFPPNVRSSNATGVWSPNSRICLESRATPDFKTRWERMSRDSFRVYQSWLGLPNDPVEWIESYALTDLPLVPDAATPPDTRPAFADHLQHELTPDLIPQSVMLAPGEHPFGHRQAKRTTGMMFNIGPYTKLLIDEFLARGGKLERREFHILADVHGLREKIVVNCTGYGARALCNDTSVTPVRGQLAHLIPQADLHYGLFYNDVSLVPRRDGLIVQQTGPDDYYGFGDDGTAPDRAEADQAVRTLAGVFDAPAG